MNPHNRKLEEDLQKAIDEGNITEDEARRIYREEACSCSEDEEYY